MSFIKASTKMSLSISPSFFTFIRTIIYSYICRRKMALQSLSLRSLSIVIVQRLKLRTFIDVLLYFFHSTFCDKRTWSSHTFYLASMNESMIILFFTRLFSFSHTLYIQYCYARNLSRKKRFIMWSCFETHLIIWCSLKDLVAQYFLNFL